MDLGASRAENINPFHSNFSVSDGLGGVCRSGVGGGGAGAAGAGAGAAEGQSDIPGGPVRWRECPRDQVPARGRAPPWSGGAIWSDLADGVPEPGVSSSS